MKVSVLPGLSNLQGTGIWQFTQSLLELSGYEELKIDLYSEPAFIQGIETALLRRLVYIVWLNLVFPLSSFFNDRSIVYIFTNFAGPVLPVRGKKVVVIHDLNAPKGHINPWYKLYLTCCLYVSLAFCYKVITTSKSTLSELKLTTRGFSSLHHKLAYIYQQPGIELDVEASLEDQTTEKRNYRYLLCIGTHSTIKNFGTAIWALHYLRLRMGKEYIPSLVVCGPEGNDTGNLNSLIRRLDLMDKVIVTGYLSRRNRDALFRDAAIVLITSLYEGFGITLADCIANRKPFTCSDLKVSREILDFTSTSHSSIYGFPHDATALFLKLRVFIEANYSTTQFKGTDSRGLQTASLAVDLKRVLSDG